MRQTDTAKNHSSLSVLIIYKGGAVFSEQLERYLRRLHWSTFGQSRHSSGKGASCGRAFRNPEKWAHFAGDSNTLGYSVGFTPTIFMFSVTMSSFDMQCGQA
jgi:hypothetical protein